jgi:hypothetical protein
MDKPNQQSEEQSHDFQNRRRRLLTGTAAGAGVVLAMQAKTALGSTGVCQSPSAQVSGNLSHHPHDNGTCWGGRSPGFWKKPASFGYWVGLLKPTFKSGTNISDCQGISDVTPCDIATRGTMLNAFPFNAPYNYGVWEVLVWPTNYPTSTGVGTTLCQTTGGNADVFGGQGQLLRHLVCAYLNANSGFAYPIKADQVIAMWNAVKNGGTYDPNGTGQGMTANDIILYISGMYDTGVDDTMVGCKKN